MNVIPLKQFSEKPPCDLGEGCLYREHCKSKNETCEQMSWWLKNSEISLSRHRVPGEKPKRKRAKKKVLKQLSEKQIEIKQQLQLLGETERNQLGLITGYSGFYIRNMTGITTGLSESFMLAMESVQAQEFLSHV